MTDRAMLEVAACLWEAALEMKPKSPEARAQWDECGTSAMRWHVIGLSEQCEAAWQALPEDERDAISFDWDFCPPWLAKALGWSLDGKEG